MGEPFIDLFDQLTNLREALDISVEKYDTGESMELEILGLVFEKISARETDHLVAFDLPHQVELDIGRETYVGVVCHESSAELSDGEMVIGFALL
jgi:hypothetical protein